jgi:uncharacterized protein
VLKVHQRCNLACDYCYVYTMADQTWRDRPTVMSARVVEAAAHRIAEHARAHGLSRLTVTLHGGEPLLAGTQRLLSLVTTVRDALPEGCRADVSLQTNGVVLDEPTLRSLQAASVSVGVSLDGTRQQNDRHRRRANGQSSYEAVRRSLRLLADPRYRSAFAGLLCTVDPRTDPITCYEELLEYAPPSIDFLLPHANWSDPPAAGDGPTPYGDWLVAVFDRWYGTPRQETHVRLFEDTLSLVLGGWSRSEQVGLSPVGVVVVETDGSIEQVDSLKSAYHGACATGLDVFADPLDAALSHPGVAARQLGVAALCDSCRRCPIHRVCGAGHYAHRYRPDSGFLNPSVYCADLTRFIGHIQHRVAADVTRLCRSPRS